MIQFSKPRKAYNPDEKFLNGQAHAIDAREMFARAPLASAGKLKSPFVFESLYGCLAFSLKTNDRVILILPQPGGSTTSTPLTTLAMARLATARSKAEWDRRPHLPRTCRNLRTAVVAKERALLTSRTQGQTPTATLDL